jgi:phospholipase A-2-activating protein
MSESDWELSQTLLSVDGLGVRCAAVLPPLSATDIGAAANDTAMVEDTPSTSWYRLVAGNQGGQMVEYTLPSGAIQVLDHNQHNDAVTAVVASSNVHFDRNGIYMTACKDGMIRIYNSTTHQLLVRWQAHSKPVTSLAFCDLKERYIVSGSWDGTAKVWDITLVISNNMMRGTEPSAPNVPPSLIVELPNHENSVSVDSIGSTVTSGQEILQIVTGSAGVAQGNVIRNHTTRLWNVNVITGEALVVQSVSNDHEGPIRDIRYVSSTPSSFLTTCSNDGTVRVRDPNSGVTHAVLAFSYEAHPPMLLSTTHVSSKDSDRDLGTTTIVASAESGHVVFWEFNVLSQSTTRPPQVILHSDCVWSAISLPNQDVATCCQDGAVRIFTRNTTRFADEGERRFFESVSKALTAAQAGPSSDEVSKLHPWHLAFEKRGTSEGQVHLFNKNGVAIAAQWSMDSLTWIEVGEVTGRPSSDGSGSSQLDGVGYDHVLPIEIEQTNGQVSTLQIGCNTGENPFTAAQRFIDKHMLPQSYLQEIADYITQRIGKQPTMLGVSSASTVSSGAFTGNPIVHYEYICPKAYKTFEFVEKSASSTLEKMRNKIVEFGCDDEDAIKCLMSTLLVTNRYHASKVSDLELSALSNLLHFYTFSHSFPALDLLRLTVLHPDAAKLERGQFWSDVVQRVVVLCQTNLSTSEEKNGPAATAVPMLSLRFFCNALKGGPGSCHAVSLQFHDVLNCCIMYVTSTNKNIRLSVATLLHNVSYYIQLQPRDESKNDVWVPSLVGLVMEILNAKVPYETEALVRTLIGMGNLARISATAKSAFNANYLASKVEPVASSHGAVAKAVAKEVYNILM